jgi:hypothetical protein
MPWTMTLLSAVRKMAIRSAPASSAALSAAPSMVSTTVTSGWAACDRMRRPLLDVVAVQSYDERLGRRVAEHPSACTMPLADRVAGGDAAEDVDEHAADVRVDRMISSPSAMTCAEAPPPMSRKFAGFTPPCASRRTPRRRGCS